MLEIIAEIKKSPGSIVIASNTIIESIKNQLSDLFINVQYVSYSSLKSEFFGEYSIKALYNLTKKNNCSYELANTLLINSLLTHKNSQYKKINELYKIKQDYQQDLIIFNNYDNKFVGKDIFIINYYDDDSFLNNIFNHLKLNSKLHYYNTSRLKRSNLSINHFTSSFDEVFNCVNEISRLLIKGIDINKIRVQIPSNEYKSIFIEALNIYQIDYSFNNHYPLIENQTTKEFLEKLFSLSNLNIYEALIETQGYFNRLNINNKQREIIDKIITTLNDLVLLDDQKVSDLKDIIEFLLSKQTYSDSKYTDSLIFENLFDGIYDETYYLFILNFNQDVIPKTYKDEDYLLDYEKLELGLVQTVTKNKASKKKTIDFLNNDLNIYISYADYSLSSQMVKSSLIEELANNFNVDIINSEINIDKITNYDYAFIVFVKAYERYVKYNEVSRNLMIGYKTFNKALESRYNNMFTGIDKDVLYHYLKDCKLSYSNLDYMFKCPFSFYLSEILKIKKDGEIQEENINLFVGSLFHYCLEKLVRENPKNIEEKIDEYIQEYILKNEITLTSKINLYLQKYKKEILNTYLKINEFEKNSKFEVFALEKRYEIPLHENIVFKGFIDKILKYKDYYVVIDYKTKDVEVNFDDIIYGKDFQLPTYIYLIKNAYRNAKIGGCYLQSVLNNQPLKWKDGKELSKLYHASRRYQGYTNQSLEVVSNFDENYQNDNRSLPTEVILKNGSFTKYFLNKSFDDYQFEQIKKLVQKKIDDSVQIILNGNFNILPKTINNKEFSCLYCKMKDICFVKKHQLENLKKQKDFTFLDGEGK